MSHLKLSLMSHLISSEFGTSAPINIGMRAKFPLMSHLFWQAAKNMLNLDTLKRFFADIGHAAVVTSFFKTLNFLVTGKLCKCILHNTPERIALLPIC